MGSPRLVVVVVIPGREGASVPYVGRWPMARLQRWGGRLGWVEIRGRGGGGGRLAGGVVGLCCRQGMEKGGRVRARRGELRSLATAQVAVGAEQGASNTAADPRPELAAVWIPDRGGDDRPAAS